jgi:CheY-like chemotaxis protein
MSVFGRRTTKEAAAESIGSQPATAIREEVHLRIDPLSAAQMTKPELMVFVNAMVGEIANERRLLLNKDEQDALARNIVDEMVGLGPIEPLLRDPSVSDILVNGPDVDVIVLDRMMPNMDGMAFLEKVKASELFRDIPVIMQTAAASSEQVLQGIQAGVYYYLTKPYEDVMLLSILKCALRDYQIKKEMKEDIRNQRRMLGLMEQSCFRFKTLDEAKTLAYYIANCFPNPEATVFGLNELLINAIEHGNLGITYAEKTKLVLEGAWQSEVERRLAAPEYRDKFARITFMATPETITVHIKDEGKGFDWHKYLELSPDRATDPHGRGIATSLIMSFHSLEYLGAGNEVICRVNLDPASEGNPLAPSASQAEKI